jgi:hypothetical protein
MTRVDFLSFNLHTPEGLQAYQDWLAMNVVREATILNIWYSPELKQEIVVWKDGT